MECMLSSSGWRTDRLQVRMLTGAIVGLCAAMWCLPAFGDVLEIHGSHGKVKVNGVLKSLPWSDQFAHGTTVLLEAVPDSGYGFVHWSGDLSGSTNPVHLLMNGDKDVTAHFLAIMHVLEIHGSHGKVKVNGVLKSLPSSDQFAHGTTVLLEAVPDSGYGFVHWSGDLTGTTNPQHLTMDGPKDVTAHFGVVAPCEPRLSWVGTPGFRRDGVAPNSGDPGQTLFRFRVEVTDPNGDEPDYVRLILRKDGEPWRVFNMRPGPEAMVSGRVYSAASTLPAGNYTYGFRAKDKDGPATGIPTRLRCGPTMPSVPFLRWEGSAGYRNDGVKPNAGAADETRFRFKVVYRDCDGDMPLYVRVVLARNGTHYDRVPMVTHDSSPDPTNGIVYTVARKLPAGTYTYRFAAADDDGRAVGAASAKMPGPTVTAAAAAVIGLAAVPTKAGAQVAFTLSSAAHVQARILNIAGRPVKTLCRAKDCEAGTNTLLWNAMSDQGLPVPNGTYLVEVVAKAGDGPQTRTLTQVRLGR